MLHNAAAATGPVGVVKKGKREVRRREEAGFVYASAAPCRWSFPQVQKDLAGPLVNWEQWPRPVVPVTQVEDEFTKVENHLGKVRFSSSLHKPNELIHVLLCYFPQLRY